MNSNKPFLQNTIENRIEKDDVFYNSLQLLIIMELRCWINYNNNICHILGSIVCILITPIW